MELLLLCVGVGGVGYLLYRGPLKKIRLGQHLTRMTNIFEEMELASHTLPIGAGGGTDSLPPLRQREANAIFEQGIAYLKSYPRHEVTRELCKNAMLAERLGRPLRVAAIHRLIDGLTRMGVALEVDDFLKSYA